MHFSFLVSSETEAFLVQPEVVLYRTVSVAMCLSHVSVISDLFTN